jgi:putative DNA methylase
MLEDIPRGGPGLADELRRAGAEIKAAAENELGGFYPPDPDGAKPIAYLWARTVKCEAPNCGAEIPLMRSLWLTKKASRRRALRCRVVRPAAEAPRVEFEIFVPASEGEVGPGFAAGGQAQCPACHSVLAGSRVQAQLRADRGGASPRFDANGKRVSGALLIAVVTTSQTSDGRAYRAPRMSDYECCYRASQRPDPDIPAEQINDVRPSPNARGLSAVTRYGMNTFGDLYSRRQLGALSAFAHEVSKREGSNSADALSLAVGRAANAWTSLCRWHQTGEKVEGAFNGQKLPMVWDFAEAVPFAGATGGWDGAVEWVALVIEKCSSLPVPGQVDQADAANPILPDDSAAVWFTDPPYYDAVPYADLADFFLVWLRVASPWLKGGDPNAPGNRLSPKVQECVWNQSQKDEEGQPKTPIFFERKFSEAAASGRSVLADDGIACVVFAHKSTEGWEALLTGLIAGGFVVTASWPIATEMAQRTNARGTASLMGSVHLVCRPRSDDRTGDWADVLRELPERVGEWMVRLDREGVRGADLVFACIGPALEIFSRYSRVETADGREVPLAEYLEKVWEVVGREALHQVLGTAEAQARNNGAGALEEDARLTALFLWTIRSTAGDGAGEVADGGEDEDLADGADDEDGGATRKAKGCTLIYDIVRRFAQPLGIHLPDWEGRIIATEKGVVRLLPVAERARQLFGADGAAGLADRIERAPATARQLELFSGAHEPAEQPRGRRRRFAAATAATPREATTLDRLHTAMLLQASGRSNALRALLAAEQQRGPDFLRLGNALTALYPQGSEEKRLLDAMLLAVPR